MITCRRDSGKRPEYHTLVPLCTCVCHYPCHHSKVSVTVGNDAANDPEYLLEKLGGFDFGAIGGDEAGSKKSLDALSELKRALTKVCKRPCCTGATERVGGVASAKVRE